MIRFASTQNHYKLLYREEEREMMPLRAAERIAEVPWSLLGVGQVTAVTAAGGVPKAQVALA